MYWFTWQMECEGSQSKKNVKVDNANRLCEGSENKHDVKVHIQRPVIVHEH